MLKHTKYVSRCFFVLQIILLIFLTSCSLTYEPNLAPIQLSYDFSRGYFHVEIQPKIPTPFGKFGFSIDTLDVSSNIETDENDYILFIHDEKKQSNEKDVAYIIQSEHEAAEAELLVVTHGNTVTLFKNRTATIDVSNSTVETIEFQFVEKNELWDWSKVDGYRPWQWSGSMHKDAESVFHDTGMPWFSPNLLVWFLAMCASFVLSALDLIAIIILSPGIWFFSRDSMPSYYFIIVLSIITIIFMFIKKIS